MIRSVSLLLVSLMVAGCTGAAASPSTSSTTTTATTAPTTTATTAPSTTTTTLPPVVEVEGAGDVLTRYIASYYGYASGRSTDEPLRVPAALVPEPGSQPDLPTVRGEVAVAEYRGSRVAVFRAGDDLLGLVRNAEGWRVVAGRAPSVGVKAWFGNDPVLIAVVGSDARPDEVVTETRADSIHILGMNLRGAAGLVGIPRDSWVDIPGYGTSKINASLQAGGPDMMMATFADVTGLELDGYVLTGFEGFERLIDDALLPFEMNIPFTFNDSASKSDFEEGTQVIDGRDALAFSRARKSFLTGDFQRQLNGGLVLIAALAGAKVRGPLAYPDIIAATEPWLVTDLSPAEMLRFALAANQVKITQISNVVLKGSNSTTSGGAAIVVLDRSFAADTFADLADGALD